MPDTAAEKHRRSLALHNSRTRSRRLARPLPALEFADADELAFRAWHEQSVRTRVRRNLWLPYLALLFACFAPGPFAQLREFVFASEPRWVLEVLRFGVIGPATLALLIAAYTPLFDRYYPLVAQVVAPIHAGCFLVIDALLRERGLSLGSWMVLVMLGPFFLMGLLHSVALRTSILVLLSYALLGLLHGLDQAQWRFDLAVLCFATYLGASIHYSLERGVRKNYVQNKVLNDSAHRDALTGIYNRRMFDDHIERVWQQASRTGAPLALLIIDIDHFKLFNDSRGHQAGDESLRRIAQVIQTIARRPLDLAARYGGEEFMVLLFDMRRDRVEHLCQQLQSAIADLQIPHPNSTASRFVTVSIGVACIEPQAERSTRGFIQLADEALYAAKEAGRNRVVVMDREYETLTTGAFRFKERRSA